MKEFIQKAAEVIVDYFFRFREIASAVLQPALPVLYVISLLITGVLLWFTIYCISASNYMKTKVIEKYMDMFGVGDVGKLRQLKAWKHVVKRMKTDNPSNWKLAILEADQLMDEVIKASGYRADTPDERFKQAEPQVFSNIEELREAHKVRNRIMQEPDFVISKEESLRALRIYQQAFKENGLLD